jgi:hypothetical protein
MKPRSKMALEGRKLGCNGMAGLANENIEISFSRRKRRSISNLR